MKRIGTRQARGNNSGFSWGPDMTNEASRRGTGYLAMVGGALSLALAPIMVIIKYMTGWDIIPQPAWVDSVRAGLGGLLTFATPPTLWTAYGSAYTIALILLLIGLLGVLAHVRHRYSRVPVKGLWLVV